MFNERKSGILLHPTSLPGKYGIGTLGKEAYNFIDFLIKSGQKLWQVCPLGHTSFGDSPYQCFSAFAGNPFLIDLDILIKEGLLKKEDIPNENFDDTYVDYGKIYLWKFSILSKAFNNFKKNIHSNFLFERFCEREKYWLNDYSIFMSLKDKFKGSAWYQWDEKYKMKDKKTIDDYIEKNENSILYYKFLQYVFFKQWKELKSYANINNIQIIGDIPLYVAYDSSDCWANSDLFEFDERKNPINVAGVPPDYFSETGQLWGNPIYNWEKMKETHFKWWIDRVKANLVMSDYIRFDHFRGLLAYWAVPFGDKTAINGKWIKAPGDELLTAIYNSLGKIPMIAEDLGVITDDVIELREKFKLPGMKILQFAFDSEESSSSTFIPYKYEKNCVVYTGTHDNDTTLGWYKNAKKKDQEFARSFLDITNEKEISFKFIKSAWASTAIFAIAPLQDLIGLDSTSRMNTPGKASGNWSWRFKKEQLTKNLCEKLKNITKIYGR